MLIFKIITIFQFAPCSETYKGIWISCHIDMPIDSTHIVVHLAQHLGWLKQVCPLKAGSLHRVRVACPGKGQDIQ